MLTWIKSNWWVFLLRGIIALIFGAVCLWNPLASGLSLVFVWLAFTFIDGLVLIAASIAGSTGQARYTNGERWEMAVLGILGLLVGATAYFSPAAAAAGGALALVVSVAVWLIMSGTFNLIYGIRLRSVLPNEFWIILNAIISIIAGGYIIYRPDVGALSIIITIGVFAIISGIIWIIFAFRLKSLPSV